MKPEQFMRKIGISQYHLDVANQEEKDKLVATFQCVNNEIKRVKVECREFYERLNYNAVDVNRRVNQELNKLYKSFDNPLKLEGWFFRLCQWQRIYNEQYNAMLERTSKMKENEKWDEMGRFFETHKIPREFRFKYDGFKVRKAA